MLPVDLRAHNSAEPVKHGKLREGTADPHGLPRRELSAMYGGIRHLVAEVKAGSARQIKVNADILCRRLARIRYAKACGCSPLRVVGRAGLDAAEREGAAVFHPHGGGHRVLPLRGDAQIVIVEIGRKRQLPVKLLQRSRVACGNYDIVLCNYFYFSDTACILGRDRNIKVQLFGVIQF